MANDRGRECEVVVEDFVGDSVGYWCKFDSDSTRCDMKVRQETEVVQAGHVMEGENTGKPVMHLQSVITITLNPKETSCLYMDLIDLDPHQETLTTKILKNKLSALVNSSKKHERF